jgi:hypothetical protein
MPNDPLLSFSTRKSRYLSLEAAEDRDAIAQFFVERFTERFVRPMESPPCKDKDERKHGFAIMAISCLLIETLESFWQGWETTKRKSERAFCQFFSRSKHLQVLRSHGQSFFVNIRCGILHQAETTGGWHIQRRGKLFDEPTLTLNATVFHRKLQREIEDYAVLLRSESWDSERWLNFRKKMKAICDNCQ